ncbi:MAG: tetratricopeptide repeat protein [Spirochaetota bacterium]
MARIIQFPGRSDEPPRPEEARYPRLFLHDLGLSDDQIRILSDGTHEGRQAIFEVAPRLEPGDRDAAPVLSQTIALLQAVGEREPLRATAKGNLPTAVVKELFAGAFADAEPDFVRVNREDHSIVLSQVRRLAQKAGLLSYRTGAFGLTKAGRAALESDDLNEIYRRLLEAHLRAPEAVDRYDRIPVGSDVAETVPLLLFAARDATCDFLYEEDFAELILVVRDDVSGWGEDLEHAVQLRFFERFGAHFGLFEEGPAFEPPVALPDETFSPLGRWRRTPLFDRAFRWHVEPPPLAVQRSEVAAMNLMSAVHESPYRFDGTEDYTVRSICMRAMERCPTDADAYVVLARIYDHRPELALSLVDAGLVATAGRAPEVPDGVSPWRDHLFRDVLRLRFVRAESLLDLGRIDEAFAEFEELLRIDPFDGMGATDFYFLALVDAGDYDRAQRLLDRFSNDRTPTFLWNAALAAYARGEKDTADARREEAMTANPHVPEYLLADRLVEPPDYYTPGDANEAPSHYEPSPPSSSFTGRMSASLSICERSPTSSSRLSPIGAIGLTVRACQAPDSSK